MSSLFMGGFSFVLVYLYILVPLAPAVYIFIRWRGYKESRPQDPQLGLKVLLYYFKVLGYHVFLVGLAIFVSGSITPRSGAVAQAALGAMIGGAVVYGIHFYLIRRLTEKDRFPGAKRAYNAFNVIMTGLVGMIGLIVFLSILMAGNSKGIEAPMVLFLVYGAAWAAQTFLFWKSSVDTVRESRTPTEKIEV